MHLSLALGSPAVDAALLVWHQQGQVERKGHLPRPVGKTPPNAAQDSLRVPCGQGTSLARGQLGAYQDLQGFFCKAAFQPGSAPHVLVPGGVPLRGRTLRFPLLSLSGLLPRQGTTLG